ncbi:MAG TPA: phosphotransferase [Propionibacteriaceae bacterium]
MSVAVKARSGGALKPHPASAALEELGILDATEVGLAQVTDLSRAHPVSRVTLPDGRRWVVKRGHGSGGVDLGVECLIYRMAAWCTPVAEALPTPIAIDEDRHLLVLEDVGAAQAGSLAQQVGLPPILYAEVVASSIGTAELTRLSGLIGAAMGRLHRATAGFPLPPAPTPVVLAGLGPQSWPLGGAMDDAVTVLREVPTLVDAAEELAGPVAGCLVNHDLKWDNIVISGPGPAPRPVLLDWEMAGLGDPAWDLGCLLSEHLVRHPETVEVDQAARALLGAYAAAARVKAGVRSALARRVWLATALRTAQLALEVANTPTSATPQAIERLADVAGRQLAATTNLTQEVLRCLS